MQLSNVWVRFLNLAAVFNTKQNVNMSIDELMAVLAAAREILGGDTEVVQPDNGSDDVGVVRIDDVTATTAVIYDLGNGGCAWTLDEDQLGTKVKCLLLR